MEESKIVQALAKFKSDYAWDKSLINSSAARCKQAPPENNTAVEDFVRQQKQGQGK